MSRPHCDISHLRDSIDRFDQWLEKVGYDSYDPYDIWGTGLGRSARAVYYEKGSIALPLIAPFLAMDIVAPSLRRAFVKKERFATADAQLSLAFANLYKVTSDAKYLEKARAIADDLAAYSVKGFKGMCWGYPFDWRHVNGVCPKNTPFITTTPYCFEAFLRVHDLTGEQKYLDWAESVARFVAYDLKDTPYRGTSMAGSYSPFDESKVVNASAYRAMVLFEAARRFNVPEYREKAQGNLRFMLESQLEDGSWLYSADNPREAFIDHFHTCFVLKNLAKLNAQLRDPTVQKCIERGFAYYHRHLFGADGRPKSFAIEPRKQIVRLEMYNYAEAITLGAVLAGDIPEALPLAQRLACELYSEFQVPAGHFVTRVFRGGWRHTFPFLRWPQAQLFYALTNLLVTMSSPRQTSVSTGRVQSNALVS